jgi:hypothetical protein
MSSLPTVDPPVVSILLPVARGGEFLFESVGSVLGQTFKEWELLIGVNGVGLTEGALEVAEALAFADPRVVVVRQEGVGSKVASLNDLVSKSRGSWIALIDADDRWATNKLKSQLDYIVNEGRNAAVVGTWCRYFGDHVGSPMLPTGLIHAIFFERVNPIINSSALIRREWAWWREVPLEDYELWMRVALHGGQLHNIPAILVDHRVHSRSTFNSQHIDPAPLQAWYKGVCNSAIGPVRILTTVCNNPEYIELQLISLHRHLRTPFEFIVFNDGKDWADSTNFGDATMRSKIETMCHRLGIRCIPVENGEHRHKVNPSYRHTDTLRVVMDFIRRNGTSAGARYWMLDSDMFLIKDIDVDSYFSEGAAVVLQTREGGSGTQKRYAWPNLWWIDVGEVDISRLCWDLAPHCDTGGASASWLAGLKKVRWISHLPSCTWDRAALAGIEGGLFNSRGLLEFLEGDVRNQGSRFWSELYEGSILHLRAGSNWNGEGAAVHLELVRKLQKYLMGTVAAQDSQQSGGAALFWKA